MDISNISETVKFLLESNLECKDNDRKLVIETWKIQLKSKGIDFKKLSLMDFFDTYLEVNLVNHESITRARRKLQEINPALRGNLYEKRQDYQTKAKKQIKEIKEIKEKKKKDSSKPIQKIKKEVLELVKNKTLEQQQLSLF